jgi:hypothetical protein
MKKDAIYWILYTVSITILGIYMYHYGVIVGLGMAIVSTIGLAAGIISELNEGNK